MAPEALLQIQSRRPRTLLTHARESVPFYRGWMRTAGAAPGDIRDATCLTKLPVIGKADLGGDPGRLIAPAAPPLDPPRKSGSRRSPKRPRCRQAK